MLWLFAVVSLLVVLLHPRSVGAGWGGRTWVTFHTSVYRQVVPASAV